MKLLNSLPSVLSDAQIKALEQFLMQQAELRQIVWEDVLADVIKNFDDLDFGRTEYLSKYNFNKMSKELQSVFISTIALLKEDAVIQDILATHEMIHKDEVKSINDINENAIGILSGADEARHNKNVEIKNNILSLIPVTVQKYAPVAYDIQYYPSSLEYVTGNIPDNDNVKSGTFSGYWAADIYTNRRVPVGAVVTIEYPSIISFNNINLRGATTHPLDITSIEYYDVTLADWVDITPDDLEYAKDFYITFSEIYQTNQIRFNILQPHYDYILNNMVDDAFIIRDTVIAGRDITRIKNNRLDKIVKDQPVELIRREILKNKFKYEVGAYNINVFLKTYINEDGIFRSSSYTIDEAIDNVKISATASATGDIVYRLIQENSGYVTYGNENYGEFDLVNDEPTSEELASRERIVNTTTGISQLTGVDVEADTIYEWTGTTWIQREEHDLPLDAKIPVTDIFFKIEKHNDIVSNKVELDNYPVTDVNHVIAAKVDDIAATHVQEFSGTQALEFIVSGNNIYMSRPLAGKRVEVSYWYRTKTLVLEAILNTNALGFSFASPEITVLDLEINGVKQS